MFHSSIYKWDVTFLLNCKFGATEQTADHVILVCPIHWAPREKAGMTVLDMILDAGLMPPLPASDSDGKMKPFHRKKKHFLLV